jgi:hypothetical protein
MLRRYEKRAKTQNKFAFFSPLLFIHVQGRDILEGNAVILMFWKAMLLF